jgi:nucleoside-diphosphate-sugar epimerase
MMTAAARGVPVRVPYRAEQELPYIYIEDVAEILVRLCFADRLSRPVYVSTARSVSFAEIAGIAARLVPGAEVAFGDGDRIGHVSRIDGSRLEADLDYPLPPVAARVRDHLNAVRAADGRQPVG